MPLQKRDDFRGGGEPGVSDETAPLIRGRTRRPFMRLFRLSRSVDWLIVAAVVILGAYISWKRVAPEHRGRVWAEDGNIFLGEALAQGPWTVLFQGYAGYQHFVPRLVVAGLLPFLDIASYPIVVFAICAVLTGLTAGAVYWLSRDLLPWTPARIALAGIALLLPLAAQETIGNLADLHTYAMWIAPWLFLYRPKNWWASGAWAVLMWALVMTEIQVIFFAFLLLFRLRRRDRIQWPIFGAFLVGAVWQVATAVSVDRPNGNGPLSLASTVMGWMINTVIPLVTGDPLLVRNWVIAFGMSAAVLILIPIAAAVAVVLVWGRSSQRLLLVALLLGSAAVYAGGAWANSGPSFMYAEDDLNYLGIRLVLNIRYGVASGMMLVAAVPIAAAVLVGRFAGSLLARVVGWCACIAVVIVLAYGSTMTYSMRDQVPLWAPAVEQSEIVCAGPNSPRSVTLPVAPDRSVDLNCDDILRLSAE